MTRERLAQAFPYVLAALIPLAGVLMAVLRMVEGQRDEAVRVGLAALLGVFLYLLVFTA